jgi:peroxiredoxin
VNASVVERLPDLPLTDQDGRRLSSSDLLAPDVTVLYFLRAAGCPVCVAHARSLVTAHVAGRVPERIILVVPGGAQEAATVHTKVAARVRTGLPTTVHVVASGDAHEMTGLVRTAMLQHSGTLVVDASGRVRYSRTAVMPTGSYREQDLLAALSALRASA